LEEGHGRSLAAGAGAGSNRVRYSAVVTLEPGFPTTRWTLILACRAQPARYREALSELLAIYWHPLYVYLRRRGLARAEAEDAVQSFAVHLLETDVLARLDPGRGRLRAYLKTALQHHVAHQRERALAQKRGGGQVVALDLELAESLLAESPSSPEAAFDRAWARSLFDRALVQLREEHQRESRAGPFEVIAAYFQGGETLSYSAAAAQHGLSVPQLKSLLHRARARFRALLTALVADTVAAPEEVEHELAELLRCL
jgi:RNA polymerase sigma factor (sigma-70 family)